MSFPGWQNLSYVATHLAGRIKCCPYDSVGRIQLETCAWFLWTVHYVLFFFLFAAFNLHSVAIINHEHECNSFSEFFESF